jgi:hypothetical protein
MQTQYPQQGAVPSQHGMISAIANGYPSQAYLSLAPPQDKVHSAYAHLSHLPVFEIYSLKEFGIIWNTIQQSLNNMQDTQKMRKDLPPPPTTADALTAKLVTEYLSIMTDGGMTFMASQFNMTKLLTGGMNVLDAMDKFSMEQATKPSATIVYSRWASSPDMAGPPIIVDVLVWYRINKRDRMTGVQAKTNTASKIRVNAEKPFAVKDGKEWKKTWFRGREEMLEISIIGGDGAPIRLGKVLAIERDLVPALYSDFFGRWKQFRVPRHTS